MDSDWKFCKVLSRSSGFVVVLEQKDSMYRERKVEMIDTDRFYYEKKGVNRVYR